ncbi:MAG TPA: hypothetical protein VLP43_02175 [Solirubrobacteraceae bacterium]|nr:hypothetical protein [Solirubrobacteraceae bacterium]
MVTRESLGTLAGITLALFAVSGIIGNHQHGALNVIALSRGGDSFSVLSS